VALDDPGPARCARRRGAPAQLLDALEAATQSRISLSVRMKRSAQPLPLGFADEGGRRVMRRKASSRWQSSATNWLPWSWRRSRPTVTALAKAPKQARRPSRMDSRASKRVARCAARMPMHSAVVDGDEDRRLPLAGYGRGQVAAPHLVDPFGPDRGVVCFQATWTANPARRLQRSLVRRSNLRLEIRMPANRSRPRRDTGRPAHRLRDLHDRCDRHGPVRVNGGEKVSL
jgi:hypothetical protein